MRPSKCAPITSLKVHFYRQHRRLLSSRYALFDGPLNKSVTFVARSRYSIFRIARPRTSVGSRFDLPVSYSSFVRLSAKVLITHEV